jgi:rare lipoprotein A
MKKIILLLLAVTLAACSTNTRYQTKGKSKLSKRSRYYSSKSYEESKPTVKVENGSIYFVCSFYGKKFHGKPTANGETYDMNALTCAHKSLPFNTKLKVINEDTGKSVIVRVNDRGPFIAGRDLDLSRAAAMRVGLVAHGVKRMRIEILD